MSRRDPTCARSAGWLLLPLALGCADLSEKSTPTPQCVSGEHWVGGDIGHPEMHPGRNCLGCHEDHDGPPLVLGGTVYALGGQEDDCFGVEGVKVRITSTVTGEVLELETNRAGNFYVEGDGSTFAKPFQVQIEGWDALGNPTGPIQMATQPETGDCAQCHNDQVPDLATAHLSRNLPQARINLRHTLQDYGFVAP